MGNANETIHSCRSGCALTLAFSGSILAKLIMHVDRSSPATAEYISNYQSLCFRRFLRPKTSLCGLGIKPLLHLGLLKGFHRCFS